MVEDKPNIKIELVGFGISFEEYEAMTDEQKLQYHYDISVYGRFEKQNAEYCKLTAWPKTISFDEFNPNNPQEVCDKACDRLVAEETDKMFKKVYKDMERNGRRKK